LITIYNLTSGVRGVRVAWQCEEMGLAYEAKGFSYPPPDEHRARYPLGSAPFLEDEGGVAIGESVAMMLYLAQRYGPTPLLPQEPAAFARVLQLTVASEAALGGLMNPMLGTRFVAPDDQKANWTVEFCEAQATRFLTYADGLLGEADYFVAGRLTLADIGMATVLGMWEGALDRPTPPRLAAHRDRMAERPGYQKARAVFAAPT